MTIETMRETIFWLWLSGLLLYSAIQSVRLRTANNKRYTRFIYICAIWFASIPLTTDGWIWSLIYLPAALLVARMMARHRAARVDHSTVKPPVI
jgi:hypothetical protein